MQKIARNPAANVDKNLQQNTLRDGGRQLTPRTSRTRFKTVLVEPRTVSAVGRRRYIHSRA